MGNKSITQSKTEKNNICNSLKTFKNLEYRCSHQFTNNNLLLKCELKNLENKERNSILEVKNSSNDERIRKHVWYN